MPGKMSAGRNRVPSFQLASGTTNERDNSYNLTTIGNIFYNTDTSNVEVYHEDPSNNAGWRDLVMNNKEQIDISGNLGVSGTLVVNGGLQLPSGTTSQRNSNSNIGSIFYNTDTSNVELYVPDISGNKWFHLNLNNNFEITVANLYRASSVDSRYPAGTNSYESSRAPYNQYVGANVWTNVNFDTVLEGRRSGVALSELLVDNDIIIPSDGKYNFGFGSSVGSLGGRWQSHGTSWKYYIQFLVTTPDSTSQYGVGSQYYNSFPYPAFINGSNGTREKSLIHHTKHQYVVSYSHGQPIFLNQGDAVSVQFYHNRNSHTLLGTDDKSRLNIQTYSEFATGHDAYNKEYINKIAPRFTITRVS